MDSRRWHGGYKMRKIDIKSFRWRKRHCHHCGPLSADDFHTHILQKDGMSQYVRRICLDEIQGISV